MAALSEQVKRLAETWRFASGFPGILSEVNNQPLGKRFMLTAFVFFLIGGAMALLMRVQLAWSENAVLGPQAFNELFTMHGSTMMFLFAVPFLEGLALYLLPGMIGARDVAFPRMSAYGYWVYLFGGAIFYASYLFGAVPDIGWFGYTPLSTDRFTGAATDFWLLGLSLVEIAGLAAAVEIVVTILKFRAPGMTLGRMPLMVWALLVVGLMILIAFSVLLTATMLLELDRAAGTCFFNVDRGGSSLLWQHLFWFFGHPEVYIMFLPAAGIVSIIVPVFAQRPTVGYTLIGMGIVLTGFVSFGLWVHHMFTAGLPELAAAFFTASSLMIAIASGVQVFAWIATLWGSRPRWEPPLLFVLGFLFLFVFGGLTGVMVAVVPFDVQVHDTYFVVAHFHYVLIGGVLFPIFAGLYYWAPRLIGRTLHQAWGHVCFWTMFIGFNATFFPMHIMGFFGLPRRVYTYPQELQLDGLNLLSTAGAFLMGFAVLVFVVDFLRSLKTPLLQQQDPWRADTLEWSLPIPAPPYSFFRFPVVASRHPLWISAQPDDSISNELEMLCDELAGQPQEWRGTLITDAVQAMPQAIAHLPGPTYVPFAAAVGTGVAALGVLAQFYILAAFGAAVLVVALTAWLRPSVKTLNALVTDEAVQATGLTTLPTGSQATAWWGAWGLIAILSSCFGALFYTYFYLRLFAEKWPPDTIENPELFFPVLAVIAILISAVLWSMGSISYNQSRPGMAIIKLIASLLLGGMFFVLHGIAILSPEYGPTINAYASCVYVLNGALALVGAAGLAVNISGLMRVLSGTPALAQTATLHLQIAQIFWWFTAIVAVIVVGVVSISPYIL